MTDKSPYTIREVLDHTADCVQFPRYLGDSVYASFDGYQIKLWTDNGEGEDQVIYLDDRVQEGLSRLFAEIAEAWRLVVQHGNVGGQDA
jgi:hypothetical protein